MKVFLPQLLGILGVTAFLLSYQQKKCKHIILTNTISRVFYILQYLLLGAFSGAVLDVMGALSSVAASKKHLPFVKARYKVFFWVVNGMVILVGVLLSAVSQNLLDLLPLAGVLLQTSAFWLDDEKVIRRISLMGTPFWFTYNFLNAAYGSAVGDVLTMISILVAMIKYQDFKHKNPP